MKMWGFEYKTVAFTWVKTNKNGSVYMGMGRYTRANAEIALLGKRGKGLKRQSASVYQTVLHERGKHSQKPYRFKKDLEELFGDVDRLEMFSREKTDGWDVWGNEVESDIELTPTKTDKHDDWNEDMEKAHALFETDEHEADITKEG